MRLASDMLQDNGIIATYCRRSMTRPKILTQQQKIEIVDALASGIPQSEIAKNIGVSRYTIYRFSQSAEFTELQMRPRELTDRERGIQELEEYRDRRRATAMACQGIAVAGLRKLKERFEEIDPKLLSPRDTVALIRLCANLSESGSNSEAEYLGLDKLVKYFQDQEKEESSRGDY